MLFACSSGATVRYLEDVVRAISMPAGSHLQFRYATKYIHPDLVRIIESSPGSLVDDEVVLAYLNQSPKQFQTGAAPRVVPCRRAVLRSVDRLGTSVVLVFELRGFPFPKQREVGDDGRTRLLYDAYQSALISGGKGTCDLPIAWKKEEAPQRAQGYWLCRVERYELEMIDISPDNELWIKWEQLVRELGQSSDFSDRGITVFYHLLEMLNERTRKTCVFADGKCVVAESGEHSLKVYAYATIEEVANTTWIRARSLSGVVALHTNPLASVDSGYDIKRIRFNVPESPRRVSDVLALDFLDKEDQQFGKAQIDIILDIRAKVDSLVVSGIAAGLAGAVPAIVALWKATPGAFGLAALMIFAACFFSFIGAYYRRAGS